MTQPDEDRRLKLAAAVALLLDLAQLGRGLLCVGLLWLRVGWVV